MYLKKSNVTNHIINYGGLPKIYRRNRNQYRNAKTHANKIDIRFDFCGEQMINGSHIHTSQAKTVPAIQKIRIITETGTGVAKTLMVPNLHAGATSYKLRIFINRIN